MQSDKTESCFSTPVSAMQNIRLASEEDDYSGYDYNSIAIVRFYIDYLILHIILCKTQSSFRIGARRRSRIPENCPDWLCPTPDSGEPRHIICEVQEALFKYIMWKINIQLTGSVVPSGTRPPGTMGVSIMIIILPTNLIILIKYSFV